MAIQSVAIAVHAGVQALDVAGPADVFNEANSFLPEENRYATVLVAAEHGPLKASNGMQLIADLTFDEAVAGFDILLVAGGPTLPTTAPNPCLVGWIRTACDRAGIYGSICTGAFVLGHAGLLDDRRVTTHWQNAQQLAASFPLANVEPDAIYVRDGSLVTSAGVTAGIDLALALVAERYGSQVAVAVAKRLVVVAQRQGGQSQFSPYLSVPSDPASPVARIQSRIVGNMSGRHTLELLAAEAGMSARNLVRYFMEESGVTPHEFIQRARVDAARMLLEASSRPLKTIAYECGFGTTDRMRVVFGKRLGVTPAQYRASFRKREDNAIARTTRRHDPD